SAKISASSVFSAAAMSRVASAGSSVGVASGALRRALAALTCFGFSIGVVSSVFVMHGHGVARWEGFVEALVHALLELFLRLFGQLGFHHGEPLAGLHGLRTR